MKKEATKDTNALTMKAFHDAEKKFKDTELNFNEPYVLLVGEKCKNVIFSCPHAVSQTREGMIKKADINTGPLGYALNKLGYTVFIRTQNNNDDPNWDVNSTYKDFLSDYIYKNKIKILFDLHGMKASRKTMFCLGTAYGSLFPNHNQITSRFYDFSAKRGHSQVRDNFPFNSSNNNTVSSTIFKKNKIDTLQIEINSKLFENDKETNNVFQILDEFAGYVNSLTEHDIKKIDYMRFLEYDNKLLNEQINEKTFLTVQQGHPILICTPDSQSSVDDFNQKNVETFTGSLTHFLSNNKLCDSIIKTKKTYDNGKKEYIDEVLHTCANGKYKIIVELHTMNENRHQNVCIVCNNGETICKDFRIVSAVIQVLTKYKINNYTIDYPFNHTNNDKTIVEINKKTKIPCFQIIVNQRYMSSKKDVQLIYNVLQDVIYNLSLL